MSKVEQTLSLIKPDAVERNLEEEIKQFFIKSGFKITKQKKVKLEKKDAEIFYKVHETKPFYNDLCSYLSTVCFVLLHRFCSVLQCFHYCPFWFYLKMNAISLFVTVSPTPVDRSSVVARVRHALGLAGWPTHLLAVFTAVLSACSTSST